jgi:hypothetical protein
MKKLSIKAIVVLMAGSLLSTSCIGSFSLFNKYEQWQCNMTSNKFVNGIVGLILQPIVGSVCLVVDALVLNTIEFWSGNNPMAAGETRQVMGQDGRYYAVKTLIDGYEITTPDGQMVKFVYDKQNDAWMQVQNGVTKEMFRFNEDGTVKVNTPEGPKDVALNEAGLYQVQMACSGNNFWACR